MAVSESQKKATAKWQKSNTTIITIKLQNKGDKYILDYLEGKPKATVFKNAIKEYMKNHQEE